MAAVERTIRNVFEMKDKVSPGIIKIRREVETLSKDYKTLATTTGTVEKIGGKYEKRMRTVTDKTKTMSKRLGDLGSQMYRTGRRTMYMGFVMSSMWRRVSRAISGVVKMVGGLIKEFSSAEKASDWLGRTLQRLAMGGALTGDKIEDLMRIWQRWYEATIDLGVELAYIEEKFIDLKLTAVESTTDFVRDVNIQLDKLDWDTVTAGVGDMADAFYSELLESIKSIMSDENLPKLVSSMEGIGVLAGTFMSGVLEQSVGIVKALGNIIGAETAESDSLKGVIYWLGRITVGMGAIAIPVVTVGAIAASVTAILTVLRLIPPEIIIAIVVATIITGAFLKLLQFLETYAEMIQLPKLPFEIPSEWGGTAPDLGLGDYPAPPMGDLPEDWGQVTPPAGFQAGGLISQTGKYYLHAGERVVSTRGQGRGATGDITINVYGARNAEETAQAIGRKVRTVLLLP